MAEQRQVALLGLVAGYFTERAHLDSHLQRTCLSNGSAPCLT